MYGSLINSYITNVYIYFLGKCKYHTKIKKKTIKAKILKTQYNLKPPLLNRKNKHLKKVSFLYKCYNETKILP